LVAVSSEAKKRLAQLFLLRVGSPNLSLCWHDVSGMGHVQSVSFDSPEQQNEIRWEWIGMSPFINGNFNAP
jgi:hypothetical protein